MLVSFYNRLLYLINLVKMKPKLYSRVNITLPTVMMFMRGSVCGNFWVTIFLHYMRLKSPSSKHIATPYIRGTCGAITQTSLQRLA